MQATKVVATTPAVVLQLRPTRHRDDLDQAFTTALREHSDAMLMFTHGFAVLNRDRIIELAARHQLPTLYGWRDFVDEEGLMSYDPDIQVLVRAASYVDRIIKGEKLGDLHIEQPTRLQLIMNLRTATALGSALRTMLLACRRSDRMSGSCCGA